MQRIVRRIYLLVHQSPVSRARRVHASMRRRRGRIDAISLTPGGGNHDRLCFRLAAFAPSLPRAVRVCFGRWAMVRFFLAAVAAFLMFRRAAVRCFRELMVRYSKAACAVRRRRRTMAATQTC